MLWCEASRMQKAWRPGRAASYQSPAGSPLNAYASACSRAQLNAAPRFASEVSKSSRPTPSSAELLSRVADRSACWRVATSVGNGIAASETQISRICLRPSKAIRDFIRVILTVLRLEGKVVSRTDILVYLGLPKGLSSF